MDNEKGYIGSEFVFCQRDLEWTKQGKLVASDWSAFDLFGCSVALLSLSELWTMMTTLKTVAACIYSHALALTGPRLPNCFQIMG